MNVYNSEQLVSVHVHDKSPIWEYPVQDNIVYHKPEVVLIFSNNQRKVIPFNTLGEAFFYQAEIIKKKH